MNLLAIDDLSESQILEIFKLAQKLKSGYTPTVLDGKTFVLFFPESSIRSRISFEKGIQELGGECIVFPPETLDKRESVRDVIRYVENWADGVVIRHSDFRMVQELAGHASIPVVNAMTSENHPCEILSDLFSISEIRNNYKELTYTFVGAVGNIANSWLRISEVMNLDFNQVCMSGYDLRDATKYQFHTNLMPILQHTGVILTDPLPEELRNPDYISKYQITLERLSMCKENAMLNPCPPFFRGEEVSGDAIDSEHFVGYGFKKNLIYVQQAILIYCCGLSEFV